MLGLCYSSKIVKILCNEYLCVLNLFSYDCNVFCNMAYTAGHQISVASNINIRKTYHKIAQHIKTIVNGGFNKERRGLTSK